MLAPCQHFRDVSGANVKWTDKGQTNLTAVSVTAQNDIGSHRLTIAQDIGRVGEQEAESILWNFPQSLDNIITMPMWVSSPSDPNPVPELDGFIVKPVAAEGFQKLCEVT
jgi:hypothetical protein